MGKASFAVYKSVGLHAVLGGLLVVSMDFHTPPMPTELSLNMPIEAVVIDESVIQQQLDQIRDKKEQIRRAEEKKVQDAQRKIAEEKKRKEREKKRKAEAERKKKLELEKKRKQEQEKKRAEEKAKKEKEQREKAEREAAIKRQEDQERAEQERILQEQIVAERAAQAKRRQKVVLSEVQKYTVLITQAIQRNIILDEAFRGKSCRINIRLASNGLVIKADVLQGDAALCRAAKTAVFKSDTLPVSKEPDVYEKLKDINLTVRPEL